MMKECFRTIPVQLHSVSIVTGRFELGNELTDFEDILQKSLFRGAEQMRYASYLFRLFEAVPTQS